MISPPQAEVTGPLLTGRAEGGENMGAGLVTGEPRCPRSRPLIAFVSGRQRNPRSALASGTDTGESFVGRQEIVGYFRAALTNPGHLEGLATVRHSLATLGMTRPREP